MTRGETLTWRLARLQVRDCLSNISFTKLSFRKQDRNLLLLRRFFRTGNYAEEHMTEPRIIVTSLLSLALAGPAIAASDGAYGMHRAHRDGRVIPRVPTKDFGMKSPAYYPWQLGTYDDGNYLASPDDLRVPPSANGG